MNPHDKCLYCRKLLHWKADSFISRYMGIILRASRAYLYEFGDEEPEFLDWLKQRYDIIPAKLYMLCLATGYYGDYDKCMEWYRRRYRKEIKQGRALQKANPFINNNQED